MTTTNRRTGLSSPPPGALAASALAHQVAGVLIP
jgi:hypothetical protein